MHIKSLKIHGFKSYRDETLIDPFSSGLNLLVGRNGSGKSNCFSAIRFVLSDAYTTLSREERQALLHDGSTTGGVGAGTMSAYVEIEFDNVDGRFPTNGKTVILRRTIGLKKDEYQLDRKSTSKSEVMSILESAGFSRSNPYYIVPQGRITHLTNQKDHDRLLLLKEVAGTKVYEERRNESVKIMEDTEAKRTKITDALEYIDERLNELEEEKEELKQFQIQDRSRRSLEYTIYQRELKEVSDALDTIEEERRRDIDAASTRRDELSARQRAMAENEEAIAAQKVKVDDLKLEQTHVLADRRETNKAKAEVECIIRDGEEAGERNKGKQKELEKELKKVEKEIDGKETDLMEVTPEWEDKVKAETKARSRIAEIKTHVGTLTAKMGRSNQFKTQKERDAHLKEQIASKKGLIHQHTTSQETYTVRLKSAKIDLEAAEKDGAEAAESLESSSGTTKELSAEITSLQEKEAELGERRKDLWKEDSRLAQTVKHTSDQLKDAENNLSRTMDRQTFNGLKNAGRIADRLELDGYYGPLYDLFRVDDRYKTAAEVTGGTSLFHVVVDTDETANKIIQVMTKEKLGRITFIPLNRVKNQEVNYPNARDTVALIKKLEFDAKFSPAFEQVFGRTIVCQTLEVAGAYTRSHGLNSITLEGDRYDRKGSITGGFHDSKRSRLDAVRALKTLQAKLETETEQRAEVTRSANQIDQAVTKIKGDLKVAQSKFARLMADREPLRERVESARLEEERQRARIQNSERNIAEQTASIKAFTTEIAAYEKELKTPMTQTLSDDELDQMEELNKELRDLQKKANDLSVEVGSLLERKDIITNELNDNLRPRRNRIQSKIERIADQGSAQSSESGALDGRKREISVLTKKIAGMSKRLEEIEGELEATNTELQNLEREREKMQTQQAEDSRLMGKQQKGIERYLAKKANLVNRRDEVNKDIRDLGVLPEEAFTETTTSTEKLMKKLHKVNEALKGFAHVNRKAYEQYTNFNKQRDELLARKGELDKSAESIEELIHALDMRKDEAISRTFDQVSKYFEEIFAKLVPAGRGRLVMLRSDTVDEDEPMDEDEDEDEDEEARAAKKKGLVESYTGVAIKVSFNSKKNEGLRIQQLSGGQKAVVALAMIFAIQKCDPAPFYLFDEIDANLDAERRTAVAAMINELAEDGQYICTTFRPELIKHASSFFGVIFDARKVSSIKAISAEECHAFVEASENVREPDAPGR